MHKEILLMADIQAKLPDGTILNFPDGTPNSVIQAAAKRFLTEEKPQIPSSETVIGTEEVSIQPDQPAQGGFVQGAIDVGAAIAKPFQETDFGFDPDTQTGIEDFKSNLSPADQLTFERIARPILAVGEGGLSILEGISATIKGGAGGVASLVRSLGGFEGKGFSPETGEKKLARDLDLVANLGLLIGGVRPTTGLVPKPTRVQTRQTITRPLDQRRVIETAPTEEVLRQQATQAYRAAEEAGVSFKQEGIQNLIQTAEKRVGKTNPTLHPDTQAALNEVRALGEKDIVTLSELEDVRRIVGDATASIKKPDARLAFKLRDTIDDFVLRAKKSEINAGDARVGSEQLTRARDLWNRLRKSEVISKSLRDADLVASPGARSIRSQFASLLRNEKKRRLFNKEEISAIERVAKGNVSERALDVLSKFAPENTLTSLIGIGGGGAAAGVPGAVALPVAGQIARASAASIKRSNADFVQALVRSGVNRQKAQRAVIIKNKLEALGTFESQAAENLARLMAFGVIEFGKGEDNGK